MCTCQYCGGEVSLLGTLGATEFGCCRTCGMNALTGQAPKERAPSLTDDGLDQLTSDQIQALVNPGA